MSDQHLRHVLITMLAVSTVVLPSSAVLADPCWSAPVSAPVTDPFRPPRCRWCAGNRGIEFGTHDGDEVRAVATGTVTFSGTIAGITYVVVQLAGQHRVTYGALDSVSLRRGDTAVRGTVVGTAVGYLHFGLRDGDTYIDPAPFLGSLTYPVRLVPVADDRAAPVPPAQPRCVGNTSRHG